MEISWGGRRASAQAGLEMVLEGNTMGEQPVEAGIPQGSPVSPILFAIFAAGLIVQVERKVGGAEGPSFVDDLGWVVPGGDINQWLESSNGVQWRVLSGRFDEDCSSTWRRRAILFTRRRGHVKYGVVPECQQFK
jgi:hypothetical protein